MKTIMDTILSEMKAVLININLDEISPFAQALKEAKRIYVYGEGRSGFMAKAFAMRMMHAGFTVYVVGETITPSIEQGDLLVAISGSGETDSIYQFASKAKKIGAEVILVTTDKESKIAKISDSVLVIPAATKYRKPGEPSTIQPLGNQFDQAVHLVLDGIIISLLQEGNEQDLNEEMRKRHTNLE